MSTHIEKAIKSTLDDLCLRIIAELKSYKGSYIQSGEDSNLSNLWEEFAYQIQFEESIFWEYYVKEVNDSCLRALSNHTENELFCIWAIDGNFAEWSEVSNIDFDEFIVEVKKDVLNILYALVYDHGKYYDLPEA